ncbi:MAG TPA: penicillin acylase family protein [Pseudomonadales bacterium]|nr:penicillin acylase family protein [Pseudomonadales bacterium]
MGVHQLATGVALVATLLLAGCTAARGPASVPDDADQLPGTGTDSGETVLYRDQWGVAHIYSPTVAGGIYAMGWAQAEDRSGQLLENLKLALGEYAEVVGPAGLPFDVRARLFGHYRLAQAGWAAQSETDRAITRAFARGVDDWLRAHPEKVPAWWGDRRVDPLMIDAFNRLFLYNWSIDEGLGDLRRGGVDPALPVAERASNEWAVAPSRSASGNALLLADPHLAWWGPSRFWEVRLHAGNLVGSGVTLAGAPWIGLGHNANVAWAMTTGGPDTADAFELVTDPARPGQYRYDDEWRDFRVETVVLDVLDEDPRRVTLEFSHQGPVVARSDDGTRAWVVAIAYDETAQRSAAWRDLNLARDVSGVIAATRHLAMFPQNVMAADTAGNIYYQRTGRVPVRAAGHDWSRPVDGSSSATAWQGFHPAKDLVQILNPAAGYMQNNNIPPDAMMVRSPLQPEGWLPEIYASAAYGPQRSGWINQRGARALELLDADTSVTVHEMLAYATDLKPFGIDRWLAALDRAVQDSSLSPEAEAVLLALMSWDGHLDPDSSEALHYLRWRERLAADLGAEGLDALRAEMDPWYAVARGLRMPMARLDDAQLAALAGAFSAMVEALPAQAGGPDARWGDLFRVGRDDRSWPVGGASNDDLGITTLRTMGYGPVREDGTRRGVRGQTSTQVIELARPIRSWSYLPVGQSDDPASPHYDDQARELFSKGTLKATNWRPEDLRGQIESRTVLTDAP